MRTILVTIYLLLGCSYYLNIFAAPVAKQMLLVTTANPHSIFATLQRYQRQTDYGPWIAIGAPFAVVVGENGVTNNKHEGDLKTPLGNFNIISAFGLEEKSATKIFLPYRHIDNNTFCVDDPNSQYYNRIIEINHTKPHDWSSGEKMDQYKTAYQFGLFIDYNTNPQVPYKGSCIFIHVWKNSHSGTAGCIAMAKKNMQKILGWLDENEHPKIKIQELKKPLLTG